MELKIKWTDFSKRALQDIFEYYKEKAGSNVARKLVTEIAKETVQLRKHPAIGQEEELLKNDSRGFRYLIHKNYKIIYWVNLKKNTIEIFDVFDTRQNPVKMKRVK